MAKTLQEKVAKAIFKSELPHHKWGEAPQDSAYREAYRKIAAVALKKVATEVRTNERLRQQLDDAFANCCSQWDGVLSSVYIIADFVEGQS